MKNSYENFHEIFEYGKDDKQVLIFGGVKSH